MEDITRRLRLTDEAKAVERERSLATQLYRDAIETERSISEEEMKRVAKRSIVAACAFWEEWDIAVLTPDVQPGPEVEA